MIKKKTGDEGTFPQSHCFLQRVPAMLRTVRGDILDNKEHVVSSFKVRIQRDRLSEQYRSQAIRRQSRRLVW